MNDRNDIIIKDEIRNLEFIQKIEKSLCEKLNIPTLKSGNITIRNEKNWRENEKEIDYCWLINISKSFVGWCWIFSIKFNETHFREKNNPEKIIQGIFTTDKNATIENATDVEDVLFEKPKKFDQRLLSYFARVQYDYKGRILFSGVIRRDGSTRFAPNNRFGYFQSASIGAILIDNGEAVNFLKLRGSYGVIGNDRIGDFRYVSLLNGEGVYVFNETRAFGAAAGALSNPEIKWEEQKAFDIGFETRFFNNKIDISADYFKRTTENLLLPVESKSLFESNISVPLNPTAPMLLCRLLLSGPPMFFASVQEPSARRSEYQMS